MTGLVRFLVFEVVPAVAKYVIELILARKRGKKD